jgi:hypothetical protein
MFFSCSLGRVLYLNKMFKIATLATIFQSVIVFSKKLSR